MIQPQRIARIISDIFIPPTFTLIGFTYLSLLYTFDPMQQIVVIISAILFGVGLPIGFFIIFRKRKIVSDNDAVIKEQRLYPFITSIILSLLGFFSIYIPFGSTIVTDLWLTLSINSIGLLVINYFWKISAHAIGSSTLLGLLYFLDSSLFPYFLFLVLIIGWARYTLRVHTPAQIIAGTLFGFFMTLFILNLISGAS